jgi:hypothetical protein
LVSGGEGVGIGGEIFFLNFSEICSTIHHLNVSEFGLQFLSIISENKMGKQYFAVVDALPRRLISAV